jgi:hypothetical protein
MIGKVNKLARFMKIKTKITGFGNLVVANISIQKLKTVNMGKVKSPAIV